MLSSFCTWSSLRFNSSMIFLVFDGLPRFHLAIALRHFPIFSYSWVGSLASSSPHPCLTVSKKPSLPNHLLSNLKPLRPLCSLDFIRTRTGLWSEPQRSRYSTSVWEKIWCQSSLPTALSRRHYILPDRLRPAQEKILPEWGIQ